MHGDFDERDNDQVHDQLQWVPEHVNNTDAAAANSDACAGTYLQNQSHQRGRDQDTSHDLWFTFSIGIIFEEKGPK